MFNLFQKRDYNQFAKAFLIIMLSWLVLSSVPGVSRFIAKPLMVLDSIFDSENALLKHTIHTLKISLLGFLIGFLLACLLSLISIILNNTKSFLTLSAFIIYSIPLIALAPVSALLFGSSNTGIVLGSIGSFLPILLTGLSQVEQMPSSIQQITLGFGADRFTSLRFIRIPLLIRGWLLGAQSGWLWTVLGALIGDSTGSTWGLGTFLNGTLTQNDINKVWAVVLLCLVISSLGILVLRIFISKLVLDSKFDPITTPIYTVAVGNYSNKLVKYIFSGLIILLMWQTFDWLLNQKGGIFSGPLDIIELVIDIKNGKTYFGFNDFFLLLAETWKVAAIGLFFSLFIAFSLASIQFITPNLSYPFIIILFITQVTPIVAFIPFIAFYLGRNDISVILIVVFSTVYPSYLIYKRALVGISNNAIELAKGFGGNSFGIYRKIRLPNTKWASIVAIRLALGRALLGAITGQYFLTYSGLGGFLGKSRHLIDFRLVWFVCLLVAISSLIMDLLFNIFGKWKANRLNF